MITILYYVT